MGLKRKMQRQIQRNNGTLVHKKVIAKKMGCSVREYDERMKRRERNLKKMEDKENGTE